nr:hypothetical protein [Tanacetum cinerariifolium]
DGDGMEMAMTRCDEGGEEMAYGEGDLGGVWRGMVWR